MTILELVQLDTRLKRRARTHGGEYAGPCPFCGGRDRFRVWPNEDGGRWWCRRCGKQGDAVQYLRETKGLSYLQALTELGREPMPGRVLRNPEDRSKPSPSDRWRERAGVFLERSQEVLSENAETLSWLRGRGLRDEAIKAARLGWNSRTRHEGREAWGLELSNDELGQGTKLWLPAGLVIPLVENGRVSRLRIRRPQGEPRYVVVSGSDMNPMTWTLDRGAAVIVESELDGLLVNQEAGDLVGTVALGSVQARPDRETREALNRATLILVSLDFDEAGARASWGFWSEAYGSRAKRWPVPIGKDPSEALQMGLNIRAWVEAGVSDKLSSTQSERQGEVIIRPFPREWLQRFDELELERLAIMTIDGGLTDEGALGYLGS